MFLKIWAIVKKDIISELRSKEILTSMFLFAMLVIVIFNFTFEPGSVIVKAAAPGILWVAFTFAGILGLNHSMVSEKENSCLNGLILSPLDRGIIYLGKMIGNIIFMIIIEAISLVFFSIFFNLDLLSFLFPLLIIILLATIGFASVGTLLAAMSINTRTREVMLPLLLFPILVPVIVGAVKSTEALFKGKILADITNWMNLLGGFDIIFIVLSFLVFEYVIEE
ncbi:MAG: heme exporter protein CcmB [Candidatus Firestonebacteria bacterium]|nr:heme exporter protein CcmB [Candidatus Firestonebacteria bacterium]